MIVVVSDTQSHLKLGPSTIVGHLRFFEGLGFQGLGLTHPCFFDCS